MPFQILGLWLRPLLSLALLGTGIYLIKEWSERRHESAGAVAPVEIKVPAKNDGSEQIDQEDAGQREMRHARNNADALIRDSSSRTGSIPPTLPAIAFLVGGVALVLWSLAGGWISSGYFFRPHDVDPPQASLGGVVERLPRPDGSELHVECFGAPAGIPLILTHGWGLDSKEWTYARKELASRCRIIVWDLPGLGRSKSPANNDWSLEKLAHDLSAVIAFAGNRPVILAGHSIGGMIILTYCRLFPKAFAHRIAGLVLAQTTYTNPVRTTSMAGFYRAIQKPVLEPLCYLMIWLAPLVWLMNWYGYLTGANHRSNHRSFFSGKETREQLGFITRYTVKAWPSVIARGLLGMFHYDATSTLPTIPVPTLVVDGARDETCKPEASQTMSRSIRNARQTTLKAARHGGIFEYHKNFATAIHEFISTSLGEMEQSNATTPKVVDSNPGHPRIHEVTGDSPALK